MLEVVRERGRPEPEEPYRLLFDSNPIPMWVFDTETLAFLAVNDAAVRHYGYSREEFARMTIKDIRPAEDVPAMLDEVSDAPRVSTDRTWRHRRRDGSVITVEITAHSLELQGRRARMVLAHDVTARQKLEEQLRQVQKMDAIGHLAGGIAHDFNNILSVVLGYADIMAMRVRPGEPLREEIEGIIIAAEKATAFTRQLLALGRRQIFEPAVVDLNQVVAMMDGMLRPILSEQITLSTLPASDLGRVRADPTQIEQVILNLVVNARDAMPSGGKLTIETRNAELGPEDVRGHVDVKPGHYVVLAVHDTGVGMDQATMSRIFEPFFTTKGPGKGTGLGLSTVFGIVKQSGGHIWVTSEPGKGSAFRTYLPRM